MLKSIKYCFFLSLGILLIGCSSHNEKTFKVGTIAGPDVQLLEAAKKVAKEKYNLDLDIIEFTDYVQPNTSLNDGSINANMFQHQPYLDQQIKDRHYKLIVVGKTFVFPMGIYSTKIKDLQQLPQNAIVAIPNDPSNEGRALLLLQKAGLIKISNSAGLYAVPGNIVSNPKHLNFKELDAAQLARSLPDVGIGLINTNYAISAGLSPKKDAIFHEDSHSPYANVIVIREDEANDPRIKQLVDAIQSKEVVETAKQIFHDQAIKAWDVENH